MPEKIIPELGNIQKTLFLPLWGRAVETQKSSPLLTDFTALSVLEKVDYDFSQIASKIHPLTQLAWIMRGLYTDEVAGSFLKEHPSGTIVNLGCGLDTSFERNDNGTLKWYEIDLPDVINLRNTFFKPNERRIVIPSSVLNDDWVNLIDARKDVLFIAAGLLYYFNENEVKALFKRIADNFINSSIICDICSPYGAAVANKLVIKNTGLDENSYLKWGIENDTDILKWDNRYKILDRYFYYRHKKLKLSFKMKFYGYLADRKRIQYMIHLKLNG